MEPEKETIRYGVTPVMLTALGPVVIIAAGGVIAPLVLWLVSSFLKQ